MFNESVCKWVYFDVGNMCFCYKMCKISFYLIFKNLVNVNIFDKIYVWLREDFSLGKM